MWSRPAPARWGGSRFLEAGQLFLEPTPAPDLFRSECRSPAISANVRKPVFPRWRRYLIHRPNSPSQESMLRWAGLALAHSLGGVGVRARSGSRGHFGQRSVL